MTYRSPHCRLAQLENEGYDVTMITHMSTHVIIEKRHFC